MPLDLPTPARRGPRGPLALLAAAAVGAALAGGALLLAERLRGPAPAAASREARPVPSAGAASTAPVRSRGAAPVVTWRCPMHPDLPRDGPGACPVCGMRLVRDEEPANPR
jgi:heavy metal-binding protein